MTSAAALFNIGAQPLGNWVIPDTGQDSPLGTIKPFVDPYWGGQEAIYLAIAAAAPAVTTGALMVWDNAFLATLVPNTAGLGRPLALSPISYDNSAGASTLYGWFLLSGRYPVWSSASSAANTAVGIVAAGQAGAIANGKQLLNSRVVAPATTTVVKVGQTLTGSSQIIFSNTDGFFVGAALSGTGVGASAVISAIGTDQRTVTASVVSTGTAAVSVTATYNDTTNFWNILEFNRLFAQGQAV